MKNKILVALRFAISFGLLGGLFWIMRKDLGDIGSIISGCNMGFLVIAIVIFLVNTVFLALRMKIIFNGEDLKLTLWESFQLSCIGYFFNNFLPTSVGGDIVKAHCAATMNQSKLKSYASVMMDRIIGLYSFILVAAIALILDNGHFKVQSIKPLIFLFLALGTGAFVIITNKKVADVMEGLFLRWKMGKLGERLDSIYKIVHDYRNRPSVVINSLIISVISQVFYFTTIYMFFLAVNTKIGLGNVFIVMPVVSLITMIPSIGGLGVREGAMVAFFGPLAGKHTAFAVSILLLLGLFVISIIGGFLYLYWNYSITNKKEKK